MFASNRPELFTITLLLTAWHAWRTLKGRPTLGHFLMFRQATHIHDSPLTYVREGSDNDR